MVSICSPTVDLSKKGHIGAAQLSKGCICLFLATVLTTISIIEVLQVVFIISAQEEMSPQNVAISNLSPLPAYL